MPALLDLVRVTSSTTGTGTITLGSAVQGFLTETQAGAVNGQVYSYAIEGSYVAAGDELVASARETGIGTYTASGRTLTRTVQFSTNSNALLNLTGDQQVIITDVASSHRERLTANRTYYVRSDGSDSNGGLADNSSGAFLTLQAAIDAVSRLDVNGFDVTITNRIASTSGQVNLKSYIGETAAWYGVTILGDRTTPANIVITSSSSHTVRADAVKSKWFLDGMKFTNTDTVADQGCVHATNGSTVYVGKVDFGASTNGMHMYALAGGTILTTENYVITAAAANHARAEFGAFVRLIGIVDNVPYQSITVTMSGTQAYTAFVRAMGIGTLESFAMTFTGGTITGVRYDVLENSLIDSYGGGANYFPGNSAGTTATGGIYS